MPAGNPYGYLEDAAKRRVQVGMLRDPQAPPVSSTMPVGQRSPLEITGRAHRGGGDTQGDFLRIAQRFAPKPSGLDALMADAEFQGRFPNARIHKNDWLNLGDGTELIDAIRGFDRNTGAGEAWQWLPESQAIAAAQPAAAAARRLSPQSLAANDNSALARILAELSAASEGEQSPAEREALLAMLQGGI